MNTIMTKVLVIIVLALVGSLGHATGVQAKPDTAKRMKRAGPRMMRCSGSALLKPDDLCTTSACEASILCASRVTMDSSSTGSLNMLHGPGWCSIAPSRLLTMM